MQHYLNSIRVTETPNDAVVFAAFGHESRLAIFRLLVEVGPDGINASAIRGYSADFWVLDDLIAFMTHTTAVRARHAREFSATDAPKLDFVFTVCDNAAGEVCPVWPGQPMTAHWGIEDPALVQGKEEEIRRAFFTTYNQLHRRISFFTALPLAKLQGITLQRELDNIGKLTPHNNEK